MGFIDAYKRWRLAGRGMSSGKKRRTTTASEGVVANTMERSFLVKLFVYPVFIALTSFVVGLYHHTNVLFYQDQPRRLLICAIVAVVGLALYHLRHSAKVRNRKVVLVFGAILAQLVLLRVTFYFIQMNGWCEDYRLLLAPLSFTPMVLSVLLGRHAGVFSALMLSLLGALLMPVNDIFCFVTISLAVGCIAVGMTRKVRRRGVLLRAGFYVGVATLLLALAFNKIQLESIQTREGLSLESAKLVVAIFSGMLTGMVVSGLLPILESMFSITTAISWLELSDLNHKLLRRLQLEAPGTYHHSMVVASLAESAAEEVGADAAMCRVCSYFHDIGKLKKPNYFIENQSAVNPHDTLTPTMSAIVIIAHVKDGVDMAIKEKLNPKIIEVIREHHGTSVIRYFYHKALEQRADFERKVEEGLENKDDIPDVDPKNFTYPGPCPSSRESGIISLADIVESASRTLKKPTPQRIKKLVDELVMDRVTSGQMDGSDLTLGDIKTICASFSSTLNSMMHTRIDYPEDDEPKRKKSKEDGKRAKREGDQAPRKDENSPDSVLFAGKSRVKV